jgi:hypothetical protein
MAKQGKALPARRQRETENSLFIQSAESLGRVIGTLQRQLDNVSRRLTEPAEQRGDAHDVPAASNGHRPPKTEARKTAARKTAAPTAAARKTTAAKNKTAARKKTTRKKTTATKTAATGGARKTRKR